MYGSHTSRDTVLYSTNQGEREHEPTESHVERTSSVHMIRESPAYLIESLARVQAVFPHHLMSCIVLIMNTVMQYVSWMQAKE
jgi:hypothetical protein